MKKEIRIITILLAIITGVSCEHQSKNYLTQSEFHQLLKSKEYTLLDTLPSDTTEIYIIYQDDGALGGHKIYLSCKHQDSLLYHLNTDHF